MTRYADTQQDFSRRVEELFARIAEAEVEAEHWLSIIDSIDAESLIEDPEESWMDAWSRDKANDKKKAYAADNMNQSKQIIREKHLSLLATIASSRYSVPNFLDERYERFRLEAHPYYTSMVRYLASELAEFSLYLNGDKSVYGITYAKAIENLEMLAEYAATHAGLAILGKDTPDPLFEGYMIVLAEVMKGPGTQFNAVFYLDKVLTLLREDTIGRFPLAGTYSTHFARETVDKMVRMSENV